jgi:hypothetical protein
VELVADRLGLVRHGRWAHNLLKILERVGIRTEVEMANWKVHRTPRELSVHCRSSVRGLSVDCRCNTNIRSQSPGQSPRQIRLRVPK